MGLGTRSLSSFQVIFKVMLCANVTHVSHNVDRIGIGIGKSKHRKFGVTYAYSATAIYKEKVRETILVLGKLRTSLII